MAKKCALISMPAQANELSAATLAVPTVASALRSASIDTEVFYINLVFIKYLEDRGYDVGKSYDNFQFHSYVNLILADLYLGKKLDQKSIAEAPDLDEMIQKGIKRHVSQFFDKLLTSKDWGSYAAVGFSCSYYQVIASIIFSRMLKQKYPDLIIVMGGSFFEPDSAKEILRVEQQIDYIAVGYSEKFVASLFHAIIEGKSIESPGLCSKGRNGGAIELAEMSQGLNELAHPDFSDYVLQYKRFFGAGPLSFDVEISRDCQKAHSSPCLFCSERKFERFRAKEINFFADELRRHHDSYGITEFNINDALIDVKTLIRYLEALSAEGFTYTVYGLFPKITRAEMKRLSELNVLSIQVGIESLQDHLLSLMNKQNHALNCISVLKWANYYDVVPYFNILYGIPGERKEDYREEIDLIKQLRHLNPGVLGLGNIKGQDAAPFFLKPKDFGIVKLGPECFIADLFPAGYDRDKVAAFHSFSYPNKGGCDAEIKELIVCAQEWMRLYGSETEPADRLTYENDASGRITIRDTRNGREETDILDEVSSIVFSTLDEPISFSAIRSKIDVADERVRAILAGLVEKGYVYTNGSDRYIGLALPK